MRLSDLTCLFTRKSLKSLFCYIFYRQIVIQSSYYANAGDKLSRVNMPHLQTDIAPINYA